MRIIKYGTKKPTTFHGECQGCGCEFEALRAEVVVEDHRDGEFARTHCPQCGARVVIYPAKVPA